MPTIAALVTVYHGTDPVELQRALDSLAAQTVPADDILIVLDGPVSEGTDGVVRGFVDKQKNARFLRLPENVGSGRASQAGIEAIETDFVLRLDADDVAKPERIEKQAIFLQAHPEVAVVGSAVEEFERSPGDSGKIRRLPENPRNYAKWNSPLNHPSVMMRRTAVLASGGYRDVHYMEDYDLFTRLLRDGWQLHNLADPLTYFKVDDAQFARRTGKEMFAVERQMQRNLVEYGIVSRPRAVFNFLLRSAYRLMPSHLLKRAYSVLFHSKESEAE